MKKVFYFLLTLVMCVSIMPSIASASSEAGSVCEEYDPKTGYTTITTDDYTAIVPKGGEVVYSSAASVSLRMRCCKQPLIPARIRSFRLIIRQRLPRCMIIFSKPTLIWNRLLQWRLRRKLASNIEAARNAAIYGDAKSAASYVTESGAVVFDLGCIRNGKHGSF